MILSDRFSSFIDQSFDIQLFVDVSATTSYAMLVLIARAHIEHEIKIILHNRSELPL